jgi:hypothetical protein
MSRSASQWVSVFAGGLLMTEQGGPHVQPPENLNGHNKGGIQMTRQTILTKLLSALALAAILSICAAGSAQATPRECGQCGMFGLAGGQVARINAVHIGDPGLRPIEVEMLFLDETGAVLGRDVQTISPGQATFFDFPFDAGREGNRIEIRALVNASHPPNPDKNLRITVEVFDADTGRNTVFIGDPGL